MYNKDLMIEATKLFLQAIGHPDWENDPNTKGSPERVAKMWEILLGGYNDDPKKYLKFFPAKSDDMVTLTNVSFFSHCSHHFQPFIGKLHIAYIPNGKVVGLSKLVRFARIYAKRLNLQEDLTQNIADVLMEQLEAKGVVVRIEATHFCTALRGIRTPGSVMVTTAKRGVFREDSNLLNEFNTSIKRNAETIGY